MLLDPRNPDMLYAGTGEGFFNGDGVRGAGILKSTDGGETWTQLPSTTGSDFFYVRKIVMSRGSSQRLYAATRTGVFRSTDGGGSWAKCAGRHRAERLHGPGDSDRPRVGHGVRCLRYVRHRVPSTVPSIRRARKPGLQCMRPLAWVVRSLALAPSNQNIIYAMSASIVAGNFQDGLLGGVSLGGFWSAGDLDDTGDQRQPGDTEPAAAVEPGLWSVVRVRIRHHPVLEPGVGMTTSLPSTRRIGHRSGLAASICSVHDDAGQNWGQASHWWFTRGVDPEFAHADNHALVFHPQCNGTTNTIMFQRAATAASLSPMMPVRRCRIPTQSDHIQPRPCAATRRRAWLRGERRTTATK